MGLFRRKSEDPLDPQLAVQHEKEKKAEAENAALLAGRPLGYKEATPEPVIP